MTPDPEDIRQLLAELPRVPITQATIDSWHRTEQLYRTELDRLRAERDLAQAERDLAQAERERLRGEMLHDRHVAQTFEARLMQSEAANIRLTAERDQAQAALQRVRDLHVRNQYAGTCEHCSQGDYPGYAVPSPCPTIRALDGDGS